ncbi:reverse transcriptase domain-containing protein [Tanacetum coccineum]
MKHSYSNDDTCFSIDVIDKILEEYFDALLDEGSKILHSIEGTILEEKLFVEFDGFMAMTANENSESESDTEEPPFEKITFSTDYKIKTSLEEPLTDLELKPLPDNMEYVFLEEPSFLPVIVSSQLSEENKNKLVRECMLAIFHDMIKELVEVFMDAFTVFRSSFDHCLNNLDKMLQRCKDAHLVLDWEKCHFMVKEEIILGHKVSEAGLEVNKAKIDVISKLPPPTNIKGIRSFLVHAGFYQRFIKDFSKITRPLTKLLEKYTPFEFNEECQNIFKILKEKLTCAPVIIEKDTENVAADHLSRIENDEISDNSEVNDNFHRETLMEINTEDEPWALKRIIEKTVKDSPAIWSRKLNDAMWAFRTTYKTPNGTTSYKLIYGKNYHMPFEIEHRAYWALKIYNPDLIAADEKRIFQLHELDELRHQAYENSRLYKARTKVWHDKKLTIRKELKHGNKVLLFHSKYKFRQPKLM